MRLHPYLLVSVSVVIAALFAVLVQAAAAQEADPDATIEDDLATVTICVTDSEEGPQDVVSVEVDPAVDGAALTTTADGVQCARLENIEGGTYHITLTTESGVIVSDDITIAAGDEGTITLRLEPPVIDGLPITGFADLNGSWGLPTAVYLLGLLSFACGALVYVMRRRIAYRAALVIRQDFVDHVAGPADDNGVGVQVVRKSDHSDR